MASYRISSYNVNGIRAAERKGFSEWVKATQPDIICLQELKAKADQVPEEIHELGYFSRYHSAEKKGYSGVGILSKNEPISVTEGMGVDWVDEEGRVLMFEFPKFKVFSIYAPSGTTGDIRQDLKYEFLDAFDSFTSEQLKDDKPVLFCGDFNIAHTEIDIHDPVRNKKTSGFLPEEREWLTNFIDNGFTDVFRELHPGVKDLYSWWTYRAGAKSRNKGWRIDYHLGSHNFGKLAKEALIEKELNMSDHAPVTITYQI